MIDERRPHMAYILRSYPRLSQTFILHEIRALEQLGFCLHLYALTDPREPVVQPEVAEVRASVRYLEPTGWRDRVGIMSAHIVTLLTAPRRYLRCLSYLRQHADLDQGYSGASRYSCFSMAVYLSSLLKHEAAQGHSIEHLHAHFAHAPALIALLTQLLTDMPYSFTAHARDLYQIPASALAERIGRASAVVTCCSANLDYLAQVMPKTMPANIQLIRHGVDLRLFQPAASQRPRTSPPLILSVGRLVEKKGFGDLIRACWQLKQSDYSFRCLIYGDGPLRSELGTAIERLNLSDQVVLAGPCTQQQLVPIYQQADLFALTPYVTDDGDRDGVPNVLIEAMACGLPVVSTAVGGIPELIAHERNGLLAEPRNPAAIAALLAALLDDSRRRERLSLAARQTVIQQFDLHSNARQLAELFMGLPRPFDPPDEGQTWNRTAIARPAKHLL